VNEVNIYIYIILLSLKRCQSDRDNRTASRKRKIGKYKATSPIRRSGL